MDAAAHKGGGGNAVVVAVGAGQTLVQLDTGERIWFPEIEGRRIGDRVVIVSGRRPPQGAASDRG